MPPSGGKILNCKFLLFIGSIESFLIASIKNVFWFSVRRARVLQCLGRNPEKLGELVGVKEFDKPTRDKYVRTWNNFRKAYKIKIGKAPTEEEIYEFFEKMFKGGKKKYNSQKQLLTY